MSATEKSTLSRDGIVHLHEGDQTYPVSRTLIKDGNHRLSRARNLILLSRTLNALMGEI